MFNKRHKEDFIKAKFLLKTLHDNPERLDVIIELHKLIIRGIVKQEKMISFCKLGRKRLVSFRNKKRPSREVSLSLKKIINKIHERIEKRKHIIFLFKCFGDGVAHIYQSMYALKHLYYDNHYQVKEDAGYISGKSGFLQEWKIFLTVLKQDIPVVMSDVTNTIRNGDVCLLGGEDPYPIEVKMTKHKNPGARVHRQITNLNEIVSFYQNDYAPRFRGGFDAYRVPLTLKKIDYINEINGLLEICDIKDYAYKEVEKGLIYFCVNTRIKETNLALAMKELSEVSNPSSTLTIITNADESWGVAYPFTLSLSPSNFIKFIYNEILIYILIDLEVMRDMFLNRGVHARFIMNGVSAMQICKDPRDLSKGVYRISELHFLRNNISFLSLDVFVDECTKSFPNDVISLKEVTQDAFNTLVNSGQIFDEKTLKEWSEVQDYLEKPNIRH